MPLHRQDYARLINFDYRLGVEHYVCCQFEWSFAINNSARVQLEMRWQTFSHSLPSVHFCLKVNRTEQMFLRLKVCTG